MRVCLDVRYTTHSGASTFIEGYLRELPNQAFDGQIDFVTHTDTPGIARDARVNVPFRRKLLEFLWSQTVLPRRMKQRGCDIYHSLKHVGPLRCPARTIYRVPAVGQFVGEYPQGMLDQWYWGRIAKRAYQNADLLIAVSDFVRRGLIDYLGIDADRVVTIHNGYDDRFHLLPQSEYSADVLRQVGVDRPFLLSVANIVPVKNMRTALQAMATISQSRHPDLLLVIAGNDRGRHADELRQLASNLRISERVRFIGYQPLNVLLQLYNQAELLVHPSLHEGFSSTILESMACGLPMVLARSTSLPETAGNAALYHDPCNPHQLADCVDELLSDAARRQQLADAGQERVAQFTWKRCVHRTMSVYDRFA